MGKFRCINVPMMDANDLFIYLGFVPGKVVLLNSYNGAEEQWVQSMANDSCIQRVIAGDRTLQTDKGVKLVQFDGPPERLSADPTVVAPYEFWKANGIQITGDLASLSDDAFISVLAFEATDLVVGPCVHDGGATHTQVIDKDVDFQACCVSQGHIIYNRTNGNIALVGSLAKYPGTNIYNAINLVGADGTTATAAADLADNDVFYIFPPNLAYPKADLGWMT